MKISFKIKSKYYTRKSYALKKLEECMKKYNRVTFEVINHGAMYVVHWWE